MSTVHCYIAARKAYEVSHHGTHARHIESTHRFSGEVREIKEVAQGRIAVIATKKIKKHLTQDTDVLYALNLFDGRQRARYSEMMNESHGRPLRR